MNVKDVIVDMHQGINTVADKVEYLNEGIPIIQSKNFTKGYLDLEDVRYLGKDDEEKYIEKYNPHVGDILMANIGTIGKSYVITEEKKFLIAWNVFLIKPNHELVLAEFLKFYFDYLASTHYFDKLLTGGTVKFINKKKIGEIPFPKKDILEQKEIVKKLSVVESIVVTRRKELEKFDELIKARFVELFGDQEENYFGWKQCTIGECCTLKSGTSLSEEVENEGGPIPYVKVGDMNYPGNERYITTSSRYVSEETAGKGLFEVGSILFPKRGGAIGTNKKRMTKLPVCADLNVMGVSSGGKLLPEYLFAYFDLIDLGALADGSSVPQINNKNITPLVICLPPMELQEQFATFVEQVDKSKVAVQKSLDEAQLLFDSLMQKYFG